MSMTVWILLGGGFIGSVLSMLAVAVFFMFRQWMYPIQMPIVEQRGENGIVWDLGERGKLVRAKDGFEAVKLMKRKGTYVKPYKYGHLSVNKKGKDVYPMFSTTDGEFMPVEFTSDVDLKSVDDKSASNWMILLKNRFAKKYAPDPGWFAKYGAYALGFTMAGVMIFLVIFTWGKMEIISGQIAGASQSLASALQTYTSSGMPQP